MIDTIVLTIPKSKYIIMDYDKFSPSVRGFFERPYYSLGSRNNFSCKQNPTKKDFLSGIYKPRLTVTKRVRKGGYVTPLRIEFSIPKLIFSNNFDEIQENDFEIVIRKLRERLKDMEILIKESDLINANVSAIHFSKNIALTDYSSCSMVINDLAKINLTKRLDLNKTSFRNGGQIIYYHSNSYEIAIYNKIKDLEQAKVSEKRSIEKDNIIQLNLLDNLNKKKPFEVLRIEVRLNDRNKIKRLLKRLNIDLEPTFVNLFNQDISKSILTYFWDEIVKNTSFLSIDIREPFYLLEIIIKNNPNIKNSKALKLLASIIIMQNAGTRNFRNLINKSSKNNRFWYSLMKEIKLLNLPMDSRYNPITEISEFIRRFKSLKLKYYQLKKI